MLRALEESAIRDRIIEQIRDDFRRQTGDTDEQRPLVWTGWVTQNIGNVAAEALDLVLYGNEEGGNNLRDELIQLAITTIAMIESLDRNNWLDEQ